MKYSWPRRLLDPDSTEARVTGEGIFVDLGDGQNFLITLTRSPSGREGALDVAWLPLKIYGIPWDEQEMPRAIVRARGAGPITVPLDILPLTVTFRNLDDPMSIERVDPTNLKATFGSGFALKKVVMETSDEPLTNVLESKLPWLRGLKGGYLDGGRTNRNAPLGLHGGQFKSKGFFP